MYMMEVTLLPAAAEQIEELPPPIHARMLRLLERLACWPEVSGAKPLAGKLAGHWRMRTGDYRIQFVVKGDRLMIERIGHRDGFYED